MIVRWQLKGIKIAIKTDRFDEYATLAEHQASQQASRHCAGLSLRLLLLLESQAAAAAEDSEQPYASVQQPEQPDETAGHTYACSGWNPFKFSCVFQDLPTVSKSM